MTISSFFSAAFHSFYSRSFYQEVARKWLGLGMRYLLLLLVIGWIPFIAVLMAKVEQIDTSFYESTEPTAVQDSSSTVNGILHTIITQMPVLTFEKGEVHLQEIQPYIIADPATNIPLMVIDTTGKINSLQGTKALILLTKRDLYARSNNLGEIHYTIEELTGADKIILDKAKARKWVESAKTLTKWLLPLIFFPITVIISFIYSMIGSFCYAMIGMGIAKILRAKLTFTDLFRLAVVARTPVIFFEILSLISPPVLLMPYINFIFFALSLGYLFFAVSSNQPKEAVESGA